MDPIINRATQT